MSASDTIFFNCPWEFECRFYKQKKEIKVSFLSKLADITVSTYIVYVFIKIFIISIFKFLYCIKNIKTLKSIFNKTPKLNVVSLQMIAKKYIVMYLS